MSDQATARKWVRATLMITLGLSVLANVGHTILAESTVSVWLRMIGAVAWPFLVFLAVEVLVRVAWQPRTSHRLARLLILIPGLPALITSYEHMNAVLLAMGERPFIAAIGPASVDTLMVGCTLTLLFTRMVLPLLDDDEQPAPVLSAAEVAEVAVKPVIDAAASLTASAKATESIREAVSAARAGYPKRESKPRPAKDDQAEAVRLLLAGTPVSEVVEKLSLTRGTVGRYNTVINKLRALGADAELGSTPGVGPELMLIIRDGVRRERVR